MWILEKIRLKENKCLPSGRKKSHQDILFTIAKLWPIYKPCIHFEDVCVSQVQPFDVLCKLEARHLMSALSSSPPLFTFSFSLDLLFASFDGVMTCVDVQVESKATVGTPLLQGLPSRKSLGVTVVQALVTQESLLLTTHSD